MEEEEILIGSDMPPKPESEPESEPEPAACVCSDAWPKGGWRNCPYCGRARTKYDGHGNYKKDRI